jgi:hypothetical protein
MTTQNEADQQAQQIGEIRRDSSAEQLADAFGRIARDAYWDAASVACVMWEKVHPGERKLWIAAAAAVRKAEKELVRGQA